MKTQYVTGFVLVLLSTCVFSTAGIFTKGVQTDAWGVIFWRGLSATMFTCVYLVVTGRLRSELFAFRWPAVLAAALGAVATAAFLNAFKLTSVANVALIWAVAPFVTAILAWIAIRERPGARTMIAAGLSVCGVLIVVVGSFGNGGVFGDILAGVMVVLMSASMVVFRVWPKTPASLTSALSSVFLLPFGWMLSDRTSSAPGDLLVLLCFGLFFAFASVTLFEGVRRIPAAKASLIGTIETPLAPIWAFLLLSEIPPATTIAGGSVILAAVLWSQFEQVGD